MPAAETRSRRGSGAACRCGARSRARNSCSRRLRGRHTGSRRRSRRLYRRFPRRRSRAERRAGRLAADPWRRMPQCRLHPVQGAAACRQGHRRGRGVRQPRRELRGAGFRSYGHSRVEGRRREAPDDRPDRPCEAAQSQGRDRRGAVHLALHIARRDGGRRARRALQKGDHRGRLRAAQARIHSLRSAHLGFDLGAGD